MAKVKPRSLAMTDLRFELVAYFHLVRNIIDPATYVGTAGVMFDLGSAFVSS